MGINVFPVPSSTAVTPTGWTAGVAGTFTLSSTLAAGTYLVETDATQTMTITLQDSGGRKYAGTVRGGSGFITVATAVNQIVIPGSLTYPFGIQINPISVTQLAAPTSLSLSLNTTTGVTTGTWGTAPAGATGAVLFTPTGSVVNFSSTSSGATLTLVNADFNNNATNELVVAFKNSSGAIGIGSTFSLYMPALIPATTSVDYLVVAGGGAGGVGVSSGGGGGGAGGYLTSTGFAVSSSFTVTVGGGGSNSVLSSITATAGGVGGVNTAGSAGGSGGGGHSGSGVQAGGAGTAGQGNGGGSGTGNFSGGAGAGGGGGAGGVGANSPATNRGGDGGSGASNSITGTSTGYAGGGGGCGTQYGTPNYGAASDGGGSNAAGTANTGGGGSGKNTATAYAGGSGVVVIAYPDTFRALISIDPGLTYTTPTRAGYYVYRFTGGTGTVTV
jgi:hypothetical protein